jgi:hypothetical protein
MEDSKYPSDVGNHGEVTPWPPRRVEAIDPASDHGWHAEGSSLRIKPEDHRGFREGEGHGDDSTWAIVEGSWGGVDRRLAPGVVPNRDHGGKKKSIVRAR